MAETPTPRATIGIISLGDMGSGLARLLVAHGYAVATNLTGRSQDTHARAAAANVQTLPTDAALLNTTSLVLSVVPPRDALATAQRILAALPLATPRTATNPLYFADMNAVSPGSVRAIAALFAGTPVRFIDGSILGGPPSPPKPAVPVVEQGGKGEGWAVVAGPPGVGDWTRPLLPTSGPWGIADVEGVHGPHLAGVLRAKHIGREVGAASGLKMCFASLSKGYAAIAVQTVTTARRLGVLDDLKEALGQLAPGNLERMERGVVGMGPKAYRWVREMEEISATHAGEGEDQDGGFAPEYIFRGAAEVFRTVAEDTVLGREKVGKRERGTTADDVADVIVEGLRERKRKRTEQTEQTGGSPYLDPVS
ncbi:6-phosphogluconate dehydrogenase [Lasiosphaeria hispida]|uniref:6-phosphogluconate dehydrogenase n=1 Tax=Lasiosphaeria hispida TaxID=260671 RepID=A0AAJ0H6F6_9PEZI|nr:6-phosphogluconate dehydrogenase [Lasiosphaeria hispida]